MARKGGSLKPKRAEVPSFWRISKKDKRFVVRTQPGPHPKSYSYPLLVVLRDILSLTKNSRETMNVLNGGKIRVDKEAVGKIVLFLRFVSEKRVRLTLIGFEEKFFDDFI